MPRKVVYPDNGRTYTAGLTIFQIMTVDKTRSINLTNTESLGLFLSLEKKKLKKRGNVSNVKSENNAVES